MTDTATAKHPQHARIERAIDVQLRAREGDHHIVSTVSHTINVSEHGLLMEVPQTANVVVGEEVYVTLTWDGGTFESDAEIVRFESPYWKDRWSSVMGLRLESALPRELLTTD